MPLREQGAREIQPKIMNSLRPLSPHLPIYKPQLTSTFPISHRISGAFLATLVLFFYLLCLKMGLICFTYENFYQFFFYSSKLILISVEITALALSYHLYNGVRHLLTDFSGFISYWVGKIIGGTYPETLTRMKSYFVFSIFFYHKRNFIFYFCGCLSIILLYFLNSQSQPVFINNYLVFMCLRSFISYLPVFMKKKKKNPFVLLLFYDAIRRLFAFWLSNLFLFSAAAIIGIGPLSVSPSSSSDDTMDRLLKQFIGESESDISSRKRLRTEVGPSNQFPDNTWSEPSAPQVPLGEQSNRHMVIQDGQSSEAHPLGQDAIQSERVEQFRRILDAHQNIGELIRELRHEERMRIPGGFQLERLSEMFEEKYGGEALIHIYENMLNNRKDSSYYQESKTFFNELKMDRGTEAFLRKEWQGRK